MLNILKNQFQKTYIESWELEKHATLIPMLIHFGHFPSTAGFSGVAIAEVEDMTAAAVGTTGPLFFDWSVAWMRATATMLRCQIWPLLRWRWRQAWWPAQWEREAHT